MTAAPIIAASRLTLRPHVVSDFPAFAAFFATDAARFIGGPLPERRAWSGFAADAGSWALLGFGAWAVEVAATGEFVGQVGLTRPPHFPERELGWIVFPRFQRSGYGTEAARAARDYAFGTLGWTTVVSYIDRENTASLALARSLGAVEDDAAARWDVKDAVYRHTSPQVRE